jgi:hypothetical protein
MQNIGHRGLVTAVALSVVAVAVIVPAVGAGTKSAIMPTSIAGAKLGLGANAYKALLGKPYHFEAAKGGDFKLPGFQQPSNYTRIVFPKRKTDVYFKDGIDKAIEIVTWNKAHRSAGGVGPCSTFAQLKQAYGSKAKPTPGNFGSAYFVGRSLIFELNPPANNRVTAVALYDGSRPDWNKPGGARLYASFVGANNTTRCS